MSSLKYPIYIPSKGRWENNLTAPLLDSYKIPYLLVVEENDYPNYLKHFNKKNILMMKGSDFGCVSHARNFIKDHAHKSGHKYHWAIDDDIAKMFYQSAGKTISEDVNYVLGSVEKFISNYKNIAAASLSADAFGRLATKPFVINNLPYTISIIRSDLPYRYSSGVVEDLDFAFQCLMSGYWTTVRFNAFLFSWKGTGTRKGGYTEIDQNQGRLKRQQALISKWPQLGMSVINNYKASSLKTAHVWRKFKQGLIRE